MTNSETETQTDNQKKVLKDIKNLEPYNSCFGNDINNLFAITNDLLHKLHGEVKSNNKLDAECTINKLFSLVNTIEDKLPESLFNSIEQISLHFKYTL